MKYKYDFADYSVKSQFLSYYSCVGCKTNTFETYKIFKTKDGNMCEKCIKYMEKEDADFAMGFGVWGVPT